MFTPSPLPPPDLDETVKVFIPVRSGTIFLEPGAQSLLRSEVAPINAPESFLGVLDGVGAYSIDLNDSSEEADLEPVHLRKLYGRISDEEWVVAGRAEQIINYERTHQYCGRCGTPTETNPHDRGKFCPNCKHIAFPRLSPAMIVLVEREDEALLAWGRQFPSRFYSTLAGFVEPGESLEQAVAREVMEEVAVEVTDIRYFGSQPWPFPHSLMCGFHCNYVSGEIAIQEEEIVEAGWFKASDLPPCPVGGMSIAGWLIKDWLERQGIH